MVTRAVSSTTSGHSSTSRGSTTSAPAATLVGLFGVLLGFSEVGTTSATWN